MEFKLLPDEPMSDNIFGPTNADLEYGEHEIFGSQFLQPEIGDEIDFEPEELPNAFDFQFDTSLDFLVFYKDIQIERIIYKSQPSPIHSANPIKSSNKIDFSSKGILFKWLEEHKQNPYPSLQEFVELESLTGLDKKRIRIFLTNYRSRFLKRAPKHGTENQKIGNRTLFKIYMKQ